MAYSCSLKTIEKCHIISPSCEPNSYTLSLTFLDIPWLTFPPSQPLFFFKLPTTSAFADDVLPKLKHSLSLALKLFSLFTAKITSENPSRIVFDVDTTKSSIPLTIAECKGDHFDHLCKDFVQNKCEDFDQLVPKLQSFFEISFGLGNPLLAIQITHFPKAHGLSIGLAYHRVVSDERTFNNFIHCWASFCRLGEPNYIGLEPTFDRTCIIDPYGLEPILLKQFWESKPANTDLGLGLGLDLIKSTFVMGPIDIGNAKEWILAQRDKKNRTYPILTPYVVVCAFIWTCLVRAQTRIREGPMYFGFIAGGITRLSYLVPANYFGNCVAFGRGIAQREELLSKDGILVAADEIELAIKKLDHDVLGGAVQWISDWRSIIGSDLHVNIVGSPKVDRYKVDFGWGKPEKIEDVAIEVMRGISLTESRKMKGGMEIGIILPKSQMRTFSSLFTQGILDFSL